ncbi:MAG: hypothetical protein ACRD9Q_06060 [Nitrososphaeraceae archaeon]
MKFNNNNSSFYQVIVLSLAPEMKTRKSIDKVDKLLDLLKKHIKEEKCGYGTIELFKEYERLTTA